MAGRRHLSPFSLSRGWRNFQGAVPIPYRRWFPRPWCQPPEFGGPITVPDHISPERKESTMQVWRAFVLSLAGWTHAGASSNLTDPREYQQGKYDDWSRPDHDLGLPTLPSAPNLDPQRPGVTWPCVQGRCASTLVITIKVNTTLRKVRVLF